MTDRALTEYLYGSGGGGDKGGGGSSEVRTPQEAPDSLFSDATVRIIDVLGEGPIIGLKYGAKSVFLDGIPLEDDEGNANFDGYVIQQRLGATAQSGDGTFEEASDLVQVNQRLTRWDPPYVVEIDGTNKQGLILNFAVSRLFRVDRSTGDVLAYWFTIGIYVRVPNTVNWELVHTLRKDGKCTTTYECSVVIDLTVLAQGVLEWKFERIDGPDQESSDYISETYLTSYCVAVWHKMSMPDTAAIVGQITAQQFGDKIPTRSYHVLGLADIRVPSNYDPAERTYTGNWDGTFKAEWTNNPAWCFYELLTNERWGAGLPDDFADKWSLYQVAQYCDAYLTRPGGSTNDYDAVSGMHGVPDGFGGYEPRYTFNYVFQTQEDIYAAIAAMASNFQAMPFWGASQMALAQDSSGKTPVYLFGSSNVIDGLFVYSGSSLKARHTVSLVTWNDMADEARPTVEVVQDDDEIGKYGWRPLNIQAVGCTSRGQAVRTGRAALEAEKRETETVTFKTGGYGADMLPGDHFLVADPDYVTDYDAGRLLGTSTTTTFNLDRQVVLAAGYSHTITIVLPNKSIETRTVQQTNGTYSTLTTATPLTTTPLDGAMWVLTGGWHAPREYKCIGIEETGANEFQIIGLQHDEDKFAVIEATPNFFSFTAPTIAKGPVPTPTDLEATYYGAQEGSAFVGGVLLSWSCEVDPRIKYWFVQAQLKVYVDGAWVGSGWYHLGNALGNSYSAKPFNAGIWDFRVQSIVSTGRLGSGFCTIEDVVLGLPYGVPTITGLHTHGGGDQYDTVGVDIYWDSVIGEFFPSSRLKWYWIQIRDNVSPYTTVRRSGYVLTPRWPYTWELMCQDFGTPPRSFIIDVWAVASDDSVGGAASMIVTNLVPDMSAVTPTVSIAEDRVARLDWSAYIEPADLLGYYIYYQRGTDACKYFFVGKGTKTADITLERRAFGYSKDPEVWYFSVWPSDVFGTGYGSAIATLTFSAEGVEGISSRTTVTRGGWTTTFTNNSVETWIERG